MGFVNVSEVWRLMNNEYATYKIKHGGRTDVARFYLYDPSDYALSEFEQEIEKIVVDYVTNKEQTAEIGNTIDPYKATEKILAEYYGYAKMVETNYNWRPGVVY